MKKILASFLAVGLFAVAANADTIGVRWADTPGAAGHDGGGTVEVVLVKNPYGGSGSTAPDPNFSSVIAGIAFNFAGANKTLPADENLVVGNYATSIPSWATNTQDGAMATARFALGGLQTLTGAGEFVLGTFDVSFTGPADQTIKAFTIRLPQEAIGLGDGAGQRVTWNSVTSVYGNNDYSYKSVSFGSGLFGNPGWGTKAGANAQMTPNPLFITKVPEPTSLALVALGGFALLRRRN